MLKSTVLKQPATAYNIDLLRFAVPQLPVNGDVVFVDEGFSSYAFSVDEQWMVRVARNEATRVRQELEWRVLHHLADRLPLSIPAPCWYSGPVANLPFGCIVYPLLPGVTWKLNMGNHVNRSRIAAQLAEFLSALHEFPVQEAFALDVPPQEPLHALVRNTSHGMQIHLPETVQKKFRKWWDEYNKHPERYAFTPRLLHSDLWGENILLANDLSHAVGIIDFEMMCIGDPVAEFAALRYLGYDYIDEVRSSYQPQKNLEPWFDEKLQAAVIARELDGLDYALRYPETDELADAVDKVTEVVCRVV